MMFQNGILMGGRVDLHDRYREWRLDVDNMSYEVCFSSHELHHQFMGYPPSLYYAHCFCVEKQELLELGERIGYVSTGLKEEEIGRCLRKIKLSLVNDLPPHLSKQVDRKCSICQVSLYQLVCLFPFKYCHYRICLKSYLCIQEEYEDDDEMGKLDCGHSYHIQCIQQWLAQKKSCPVCKAEVLA